MDKDLNLRRNPDALGVLTAEQMYQIRLDQLRQQEALCEQQRLSYEAAKAAVERLRREIEGE